MIKVTKRETVNRGYFCTALLIKIDSIVFPLDLPRRGYPRKNTTKKTVAKYLGLVIE